jgi:hypothetical protein
LVKNRQDDYRALLKNSPRPWYDLDLKTYQEDLYSTELNRVFNEKLSADKSVVVHINEGGEYQKKDDLEWQQMVKSRKDGFAHSLRELEERELTKEQKNRELSHQHAIPGERKTLALKAASVYETKVSEEDQNKQLLLSHAKTVVRRDISDVFGANATRDVQQTTHFQGVDLKKWRSDGTNVNQKSLNLQ